MKSKKKVFICRNIRELRINCLQFREKKRDQGQGKQYNLNIKNSCNLQDTFD